MIIIIIIIALKILKYEGIITLLNNIKVPWS